MIWSWYTGHWWVGCYIRYSEEGTGRGRSPPRPLLAVPNVTVHPSTTSVPITVLLYNGPLLCGFNVPMRISMILTREKCQNDPLCCCPPGDVVPYNTVSYRLYAGQHYNSIIRLRALFSASLARREAVSYGAQRAIDQQWSKATLKSHVTSSPRIHLAPHSVHVLTVEYRHCGRTCSFYSLAKWSVD